jgi:hypothetical protein
LVLLAVYPQSSIERNFNFGTLLVMDQEQKNENMINPDKDRGQKEETDDLLSSSSNCHSNEFLRQLLITIHANIAIVDYLHEELRKREEILEELKANSAKISK